MFPPLNKTVWRGDRMIGFIIIGSMYENMTFCSKTGYNWLLYEEGPGMFCLLCRKHNVANTKNKSKKFNMEPAVRFKKKRQ